MLSNSYSVFYLVGGSSNFVCKSIVGKFSWEKSTEEVESLKKLGYKAMSVKNGHIVGGYCSFTDFDDSLSRKSYYDNLLN